MAARAELLFGIPSLDLVLAVLCGTLGSLLGAYFNYYLSLKLGRPILFRYGKYVFLKPETIESAEAVFRKYGDITTFACRLLPAIRQLISIPAGLSKMHLGKFSFYTALGAGIWSAVLGGIGWYLASLAGNTTYRDMVFKGRDLLKTHFLWILIGLAAAIALYALSHALVAKAAKKTADGA
jgi:membrane protein DedA with SNARE-associated domain